jgi:hypothetical protein
LHVALSSPAPWSAETQNKARELTIKTLGVAGQSDAVTFGDMPLQADIPLSNAPSRAAADHRPPPATSLNGEPGLESTGNWLLVGIPALVVLLAGLWLVRKSRQPRPLDTRRREKFLDRLRAILDERRSHVVS